MVLAGQDNRFHARRADCRRPLIRVELLGIEEHRVVVTVAPLGVRECVHTEMDEGIELELMPLELALARYDRRRALYVIVILLHICFPFGYMIHDVYKDNINFARSKLIRQKIRSKFFFAADFYIYSTVTLFARFRGLSTSHPRSTAVK